MRILYLTSVLGNIGGSEIYCRNVIEEMARQGHKILVCSTEPHDFHDKNIEVFTIPVFGHHAFHKFTAPFFQGKIVEKARAFKPDVVQSHSNCFMGWIGDRVKKDLKIPHVLLIEMISANNNNVHTKTIYACEKFLLPKLQYDAIAVWTENMKNKFLLPWGIAEEKIVVIPAALKTENYDLNVSGERVKKKYGKNLIISIKSLWHTNVLGLAYIVRAMKYVKEKHPDWKYVCIGPGDTGELKRIAREENVADIVLFPGPITNEEKPEYWAAADIAPHSFVYEFSTAISLLEFIAMGRPCVITEIGAVKEYLGDAALLVKAQDARALGEGINTLIEDKKLRNDLGKKARKLFEEKYSITATVKKLTEIYQAKRGMP